MAKLAHVDEAQRSPEREALAEAIARHQRALQRVERVDSLFNEPFIGPAQEKVEAAERALRKVLAEEPLRVVASLLDNARPAGPSVEDAELVVAYAKEDVAVAERTRDALYVEQREARRELMLAKRQLDDRIRDVVASERTEKLLARWEETQREVQRQREVLNFLSGCLPPNWDSVRFFPNNGADADFRTALMELSENPDAALPE